MLKKIFSVLTFILLLFIQINAQDIEQTYELHWKNIEQKDLISSKSKYQLVDDELTHINIQCKIPEITISKEAGTQFLYDVKIVNEVFESFDQKYLVNNQSTISEQTKKLFMVPQVSFTKSRMVNYTVLNILPFKLGSDNNTILRLKSFTLVYSKRQQLNTTLRGVNWKNNSILASGTFINIRIKKAGLYKLDKALLDKMGINIEGVDPRTIKMYGMGGGMLPQNTNSSFYNDPEEMAIQVIGEQDGHFDNEDYILFYHKGPHVWNFNSTIKRYSHEYNIYSEESGIYLGITPGLGKRMQSINKSTGTPSSIVSDFDELYFYEKDLANLSHTGREWYGEEFDKTTLFNFNLNLPDANTNQSYYINSYIAGRTFNRTSTPYFKVYINGNYIDTISITPTYPDYGDPYMMPSYSSNSFQGSNQLSIEYELEKSSDFTAKGWLNYFEIISRRNLIFTGSTMQFRDSKSFGNADVKYQIRNASQAKLLDVSDPLNPSMIIGEISGSDLNIYDQNLNLHEYIVYNNDFLTPETWYKSGNQNLHNNNFYDLVILTHPSFQSEAIRYATYKKDKGLRVQVIDPQTIYNEFSCGVQDITAIRNYMKMLYDKASSIQDKPKYLLIFGDGSYDFKDRLKNNTNFIPSYQSFDSHTSGSFCNDEYYGTLDDGEGYLNDFIEEGLDVAVGRIPVGNALEAKQMIDKLIHYNSNESIGDWRQYITIIGDDGDNDTHRSQADHVAGYIQAAEPGLNINKLYLDAYEKKIVNGVPSYPDVNDELKRILDRGCLIVNYSGHGGPYQWAHENIFNVTDINNLKNYNHLPIFMAATCDFGPFDNPEIVSAGERLMLSNKGGAIAYIGTSRIANTGQNEPFNKGLFYQNMFEVKNGKYPTIGEAYLKLKVANGNWLRNFYIMGDPSLDLGLPVNNVVTTHIRNKQVNIAGDTIKAFQLVQIKGDIKDKNNNLIADFNGTVYPTVFDKTLTYKTLGNDPASPIVTFTQQKNSIYRGKATVMNGKFEFAFIVPKDINYQWGKGKISYYAYDNKYQAKGIFDNIIIGGTADTSYADMTGPEINIYLNDEKFAYGGMTNQNPLMLLKLKDESGINAVGIGVGRNITATLDGEKIYTVNDYYQSDLDNYKSGKVRYQLVNIEDGKHTLKVKAWDVLNNSSESSTEFIVAQDATLIIKNVLNYPNPFTTKTAFHFDHNKPGEMLQVQVQILSITGQIVKNLYLIYPTDGSHVDNIEWDGRDEYGEKIGRGVYLYKIKVKTSAGEIIEDQGKLVIIN